MILHHAMLMQDVVYFVLQGKKNNKFNIFIEYYYIRWLYFFYFFLSNPEFELLFKLLSGDTGARNTSSQIIRQSFNKPQISPNLWSRKHLSLNKVMKKILQNLVTTCHLF